MSKEQAKKSKISEQKRNDYIEVGFPKVNYALPISEKWLKRIENGVLKGKKWK